MRLTAKSEYGLLALIDIAIHDAEGPVSARQVASRQDIPLKFLEQLLLVLRKEGLVTAKRGAKGGFLLGAPASAISVLDVVEALEGPLHPTVCQAQDCSRVGACAAASIWEEATSSLREVFGRRTLSDLADSQTAMRDSGGAAGRDRG